MKIVVVDDEPIILKLIKIQLAALGEQNVLCLTDAHEALAVLAGEGANTRLVFCDLQMPNMDGVEFVRHLAEMNYRGGLVLISGEDPRILQTVSRLAESHGLDVVGAVGKPVQSIEIERLLAHHFNDRRGAEQPQEHKLYETDDLRRAILAGELVNHYQPKVCVQSGVALGVETLVRWRHPTDGLVAPDQFIGCAEKTGLIDALTRSVFREAVRQAALWRRADIDLQLAVNVSMENLRTLDFPDFVAREAAAAGVPMSRLVLEITESRLMDDARAPLDILSRLRLRHIGLSIDDFGTGHSSLAQLRDIPFDEMKIDHGFVHGGGRDPARRAIVEASLAMARQLGMRSVAEGVEDAADWDFVRSCAFDSAQGYWIGAPMPGDELPGWLADWVTSPRRQALVPA